MTRGNANVAAETRVGTQVNLGPAKESQDIVVIIEGIKYITYACTRDRDFDGWPVHKSSSVSH